LNKKFKEIIIEHNSCPICLPKNIGDEEFFGLVWLLLMMEKWTR
jgi:hypothetical protein